MYRMQEPGPDGRPDCPRARAVMEQAWRVAKEGAMVMHTDFSYFYGAPKKLGFPWGPVKPSQSSSPDAVKAFPKVGGAYLYVVICRMHVAVAS